MSTDADALATLKGIEDAQKALARLVRSAPPARLAQRPVSGHWSALEHVRHLIFAEQHHFGPFLERGFRWSSVGVAPPNRTGERRLHSVGSDPATSIDEVFEAWVKVHGVVRTLYNDAPAEFVTTLEGNLKHLNLHAETIERLLRG